MWEMGNASVPDIFSPRYPRCLLSAAMVADMVGNSMLFLPAPMVRERGAALLALAP